jgi:DNA-binding MarR family transcriptional regulator
MQCDFGTAVPEEPRMPNQLSMASIQSIETLHLSGHLNREIAQILDIDRSAVTVPHNHCRQRPHSVAV